jgi:O-antigen/teichoic acid export membrane protein
MGFRAKLLGLARSKSENSLAFFNLLGPIILNGINFFTVPLFTRLLGPANYGIVSVYTAWVSILAIAIGLQTSATIAIARTHLAPDEQKGYRSSILSLSMLSMVVISILVMILMGPVTKFLDLSVAMVVIMLLQSFGTYVITFTTITFIYDKKAQKNFLLSVITALMTVALSIVFVTMTDEGEGRAYARIWGMAIPNIAIGVVFFIIFLVQGKIIYSKEYWKFCLPLALPLIFHGLSHVILSQAGKVMLQKMVNNEIAGVYSFVVVFTSLLNVIWSALNNTWVPFYYDDMKSGCKEVIQRRTKNYIILYTVLVIGFILVSPEIARLFASEEYWSGIDLLPVYSVSMFMVFLYSFPVNFQLYHKSSLFIAIGTASAAIINLLLNYLLIPSYSMMGAAVATMIAYISLFVFHQLIAKYVVKHEYHFGFKDYGLTLPAVGVSVIAFYLLKDFWYIRWAIGVVLGIMLLRRILKNKSIF